MASKSTASKSTLTAESLEALGAGRLAELLMEIAASDAATKRRLRLELTALTSPRAVATEVGKRLSQIARASSLVDPRKVRELIADLETQRRMIVDRVATIDAGEALDLMWRFIDLADAVLDRCDDSSGVLIELFRNACGDLGRLAQAANPDPVALADRTFTALNDNDYGQYDRLIDAIGPALGPNGLDHLKKLLIELSKSSAARLPTEQRVVVGWGSGGPIYHDELEAYRREGMIRCSLQQIADVQGDVDSFIAQYDQKARKVPGIAAEIAHRLLAAKRAEDALRILDAAEHGRGGFVTFDWEDARIEALEALGRDDQAQAARWSCFERFLSADHLRAYLKRLPDFDDVEAERRALDFVENSEHLLAALEFLVAWPALERAARLVIRRAKDLDGNCYEVLSPAADALAGKYPLAATLALRAMIDFTLTAGRSSRYRHAARHLMECDSLKGAVEQFGAFDSHATYAARLKVEHGRKIGFWSLVS
uniref:Uncharacterized protein n=1 Tax=Rhodopseudomonas palustris (strain BisA53) TaxID=316055 RepID=Q07ME2_RHOP5